MSSSSLENVVDILHRLDLFSQNAQRDLGTPNPSWLHPGESGGESSPATSGVQDDEAVVHFKNDRLITEYKNTSYIGYGSYGLVFKGDHYLDQSECAIKMIGFNRDKMKAVLREVRSMARLSTHQNIVSYKDSWIQESKSLDPQLVEKFRLLCKPVLVPELFLFIKLELLGDHLENWLEQRNVKYIEEKSVQNEDFVFQPIQHSTHKQIFLDVLEGLIFLHDRNIIHRDLKPANILIDFDTKNSKIGDFGLAKIFESNGQRMTRCGPPLYAAPEQLVSNNYDLRVDIYSLGHILLEVIYPVEFLGGKSEPLIAAVSATFNYPHISDMIRAMTETDPDKRPALKDIRRKHWLSW